MPENDLKKAVAGLRSLELPGAGPMEILSDPDICKISIVGVGMRTHAGVASKAFEILARENINIQMVSTSRSRSRWSSTSATASWPCGRCTPGSASTRGRRAAPLEGAAVVRVGATVALIAALVVALVAWLRPTAPELMVYTACDFAVEVDGVLRCDGEAPRDVAALCGAGRASLALSHGDAVTALRIAVRRRERRDQARTAGAACAERISRRWRSP